MNTEKLCGDEPWGPWKSGMLTECFQQVTIMNGLSLFLLLSAVFRIKDLYSSSQLSTLKLVGKIQILELILSFSIVFINLFSLSAQFVVDKWVWFQLFSDIRDIFIWGMSIFVIILEYGSSQKHVWTIRAWWVLQFISLSLILQSLMSRNHFYSYGYGFDVFVTIAKLFCVSFLSILGLWFNNNNQKSFIKLNNENDYGSFSTQEQSSPYDEANIFSKLFFHWPNALMKLGNRRPLLLSDLWKLSKEDECEYNFKKFDKNWQYQKRQQRPSLLKALFSTYGLLFWVSSIGKLMQGGLAGPIILSRIVRVIQDNNSSINDGLVWVAAIFGSFIVQSLGSNIYMFVCTRIGMQLRAALIASIYRKSTKINSSAREKFTSGEIINLQSIDPIRLSNVVPVFHQLWTSPIQIIVSVYLLWDFLGPSMIAGVVVLLTVLPVNVLVTRKMMGIQKLLMKFRDQRIKTIGEILSGIRIVKFFNWEENFISKIDTTRNEEIKKLRNNAYLRSIWVFAFWGCIQWVTGASFIAYVLSGHLLTAEVAFASLAMFNTLRMPLGALPNTLSLAVEAHISLTRVQRYLLAHDLDSYAVRSLSHHDEANNNVLSVVKGNFKWSDQANTLVLKNINISIKKGELIAVVGPVGCGKSAFVAMILGELFTDSGEVRMSNGVAYVPQQAWMQNATLKDNILFGLPNDEEWYQTCLDACELLQDALPEGDQTEIGEKGINLSGGQKQRISLARAMYHNSAVYLLDSPLSALDAHVGGAIFNKLILGALREKTRILVTHQLDVLNRVDRIIVLNDGSIEQIGTYDELMTSPEFADIVTKHVSVKNFDKKEEKQVMKASTADLSGKLGSGKLVTMEEKKEGTVAWSIYRKYIKSAGVSFVILISFVCLFETVLRASADWWISKWTSNATTLADNRFYFTIHIIWISSTSVLTLIRAVGILVACIRAAIALHNNMLFRILRAPISFFDTTPLGRMLNRFSKDLTSIDENLPIVVSACFSGGFNLLLIIGVITMITPMFLIPLLPISYLYYFVQQYYLNSSRELQRYDSISKSPIYALFSETLQGISTIRAYGMQSHFIDVNNNLVDTNSKPLFAYNAAARWFGIRLELMCNLVVSLVAFFCILERETINPGLAGLSLSYVLVLTSVLTFFVRSFVDVEAYLVSVERVCEYSDIPVEAPNQLAPVAMKWPEKGEIRFENLKMRYRHNLDFVLKGITATIKPQSKVGIIGRTGSGKSSILLCIFRLVEAAVGTIFIDNVDISKIGLGDLRSRLAIIPQDPTLFAGTIRSNLDPFSQYNDIEVWRALDQIDMKSIIENLPEKLESLVTEGGNNFSVGQRQLLCLGRALLHNSKILCIDEATASIDLETDLKIQRTIKEQFRNSTVLTIAHRINTILDCDQVMVMHQGLLVEFDTIENLKQNTNSMFFSLMKESGAN